MRFYPFPKKKFNVDFFLRKKNVLMTEQKAIGSKLIAKF